MTVLHQPKGREMWPGTIIESTATTTTAATAATAAATAAATRSPRTATISDYSAQISRTTSGELQSGRNRGTYSRVICMYCFMCKLNNFCADMVNSNLGGKCSTYGGNSRWQNHSSRADKSRWNFRRGATSTRLWAHQSRRPSKFRLIFPRSFDEKTFPFEVSGIGE